VATVVNITILNAVSGSFRAAASARLLLAAPRPWMSGAGVCPAPVHLRRISDETSARPDGPTSDERHDNGRIEGTRIGVLAAAVRSYKSFSHLSDQQFAKYDPGSTVLRPPV
jgi:hypothetical protein